MLLDHALLPRFFSASIRAERPSRRLLAVPRAHAFMYYQCICPVNEKHAQAYTRRAFLARTLSNEAAT